MVNTNFMAPPIAPIGLDYVGCYARDAGIETQLMDLCLCDDAQGKLAEGIGSDVSLVCLSFRNVDDCFWPSAKWFVPKLASLVQIIRRATDAAIVIGGVGYSIFPRQILEYAEGDFGICGDGEQAIVDLYREVTGDGNYEKVSGLLWRDGNKIRINEPAWPGELKVPAGRDFVDNRRYFKLSGQMGIETKRGCGRCCFYCADPVAKGKSARLRDTADVVDEIENLLAMGIDVYHTCDSEFNLPYGHAKAVCDEIVARGLGDRIRWYTYMTPTPFDGNLADSMKRAGCIGVNFTTDSASAVMLKRYLQPHTQTDITSAVKTCQDNGITVMLDLLLGGPGETRETVKESIEFFKSIGPDCVGCGVGMRIYPGTGMARWLSENENENVPGIKRKYEGTIDLLRPTFYISPAMGDEPAQLVRDLIGGDKRFFEPEVEKKMDADGSDHNYNNNQALTDAIANGMKGAYWDILRKIRRI